MPQLLLVNTNPMFECLNVALPRHIKDVLYDQHLFFTSFVNYITAEKNYFVSVPLLVVVVVGQSSQIIRSLPPHSLARTQYEIHQRNIEF